MRVSNPRGQRALFPARLPFVLLTTVCLSWSSVQADDHKYPFHDPYIATLTTAILNADDFIADRKSVEELKEALADQATLYPYGGHLGDLWYAVNEESVLGLLRTAP